MAADHTIARRLGPLVVAGALLVAGTGCAATATPTQARRNRVSHRLHETFTGAEASCVLGHLDPATIAALDASATDHLSSRAFAVYSAAVTTCVAGTPATTSSTTTSSTTTGPPG